VGKLVLGGWSKSRFWGIVDLSFCSTFLANLVVRRVVGGWCPGR